MRLYRGALVALTLVTLSATARADIDGSDFSSGTWGITMRAPSYWQMSERTSYPNIILWMTHSKGRMLLSAELQAVKEDALEYAKRTALVLTKLGFKVRTPQRHAATGAYYVDFDNCGDASDCTDKAFLRQAYLVSGNRAYSLTLATDDGRTRGRLLRAFDFALRSIRFGKRTPAPTKKTSENTKAEKSNDEP